MREIEKCETVQSFHFLCDVIALVFLGFYASSHNNKTFALSSFHHHLSNHLYLSNLCVHFGKTVRLLRSSPGIGLDVGLARWKERTETWPSIRVSRGTVLIDRNYKSFVVFAVVVDVDVVSRSGVAQLNQQHRWLCSRASKRERTGDCWSRLTIKRRRLRWETLEISVIHGVVSGCEEVSTAQRNDYGP